MMTPFFGDSQVPKLPLALGASIKGTIMITLVMVLKAVGYSLAKASLSLGASKTRNWQHVLTVAFSSVHPSELMKLTYLFVFGH